MGCNALQCCLVLILLSTYTALPMGKKEDHVEMTDEERELKEQQDMEYYRYITQVKQFLLLTKANQHMSAFIHQCVCRCVCQWQPSPCVLEGTIRD